MSYLKSNSRRLVSPFGARTLLGMLTLAALTGCMTSPHHHEVIGKTGDKFDAEGFLLDPHTGVSFQYYHFGINQWKVLGVTHSIGFAVPYDGQNWYHWKTSGLQIGPGGWAPGGPGGTLWARVRAVSAADGRPVATFRRSLVGVWDANKPLDEFWAEAGYGNEARILANP